MNTPRFFGYGSLVNSATHAYPAPRIATLEGWHRHWICPPGYTIAVLSVRPSPGTRIDGLTADVPNHDWAALDAREQGYDRHKLDVFDAETWVYAVPAEQDQPGDHVILLSYLDVVIQGFLTRFGRDGVARFFDTTDRWRPILDDRASPRYPRHQPLAPHETELVNACLQDRNLNIIKSAP
jgi:hypothetical protein